MILLNYIDYKQYNGGNVMNEYIKMWLQIIENMDNDNTYKLAWGRAILELINEIDDKNKVITFTFDQIASKMLKYYWNQLFFFDLKQSSARKPVVVQQTELCIKYFIEHEKSSIPVWFDYAEKVLKQDSKFYNVIINKISTTLKHDVCWRFKKCHGETYEIYELNKDKKEIYITYKNALDLKEYSFFLSQLLNYRWAQLLENFNNCPKITSKVKGISSAKLKRNNLRKFRDILLTQMEDGKIIDFYTGDLLNENDISVDHVIPWSFMYSDDIWNLVLTSKSMNSKKNNSIPSEATIEKLKIRNQQLLNNITDNKLYEELKYAIDNDYVQKFYISCKL